MPKDPRFNFYPDNYTGGTIGFTLEQHGAYLQLLLLNFYKGPFTETQALDRLSELTRGNAAAYAELWNFLMPKFCTDGTRYWSERLMKEVNKSVAHSEKQSERAKKRWGEKSGIAAAYAGSMPDNGIGIGNGIGREERKGVKGERKPVEEIDAWFSEIFDQITLDSYNAVFPGIDIAAELAQFRIKVLNAPREYQHRDIGGMRNAFQFHLRSARPAPEKKMTKEQLFAK